ncbi:Alpha/Beta hydrolase protein [Biscogniauxia sp. FL1348]|nr:Alpha/Beta hydrolase protein [Biscogniauxia sp. FL1348]
MAPLIVDPEWEKVWAHVSSTPRPVFTDAAQLREYSNTAMKHGFAPFREVEGFQETNHEVTSLDGTRFNVRRFVPPSLPTETKAQRAIVYVFGGGMVSGSVDLFRPFITNISQESQTQIFGVEYRVGFEKAFPAAVEDVYSAIAWLQENAQTFNVDPARILLFGPSAGGGVAAGTALFARDKGLEYPLAGQVLVAPMIDDRTVLPEESPLTPYLTWTTKMNELGWKAYLGGKEREERTDENVPIYAAPARAQDVSGLPPTYIDVGSLDLFKNEDFAYAAKLAAAGVEVEFHIYLGIPHGFEGVASNIRLAQVPFQNQVNFVKNI